MSAHVTLIHVLFLRSVTIGKGGPRHGAVPLAGAQGGVDNADIKYIDALLLSQPCTADINEKKEP